jgi:hypothetical protein
MTTPNEDPGPVDQVGQALATLRAAILEFFEGNPPDEANQQLDKDELHAHVLRRIQQQSDVAAQAADAHATFQAEQPKPQQEPAAAHATPAAPHATPAAPHTTLAAPHATPAAAKATHVAPHAATSAPAKPPHTKALTVDHEQDREDAETRHPELGKLAESWNTKFKQYPHDLSSLEKDFGSKVAEFKEAMEAAKIKVDVNGARRSKERAYLMRCAYLIHHGNYATVEKEMNLRPSDVDIDWKETRKSIGDSALKEFAELLAGVLGVGLDLSPAPSLPSNHINGLAVDLKITGFEGKNVAEFRGGEKRIEAFKDLEEVGATYGVYHFRTGCEPYHWSVDSH